MKSKLLYFILAGVLIVASACQELSGNVEPVIPTVAFTGVDSDCDGVDDAYDVCPGIDDTVDNDHNGLPDCKYPPSTIGQVISGWKCGGGTKVQMCKKTPSGGYQTVCTYYSTVYTYIKAGGYLGPCGSSSCNN